VAKKWEQFYCSTAGEWEANAKEEEARAEAAERKLAMVVEALKYIGDGKRLPIVKALETLTELEKADD